MLVHRTRLVRLADRISFLTLFGYQPNERANGMYDQLISICMYRYKESRILVLRKYWKL